MPPREVTVGWDQNPETNRANDFGVYQISGTHLLYPDRRPMLLYLGKAEKQTFSRRLAQHAWLNHERIDARRFGRLDARSYRDDGPDWDDWRALLAAVEVALIYWSSPPYNSQAIRAYRGPHLLISNEGDRGDLPAILDTADGPVGRGGSQSAYGWLGRVDIPGVPHGGAGGCEAWRPGARDVVRPQLEALGLTLPVARPVKLVVRFGMTAAQRSFDIDNALKNVFDVLGAAGLFGPSRGGGKSEWNTDDGLIWAVEAEKVVEESARTTVEILLSEESD